MHRAPTKGKNFTSARPFGILVFFKTNRESDGVKAKLMPFLTATTPLMSSSGPPSRAKR
jgi:hypothetical protein